MPTWPFGCPTGWQEKRREARLRTAMETGLAKLRRRYSNTVNEVEAEWLINPRVTGYQTMMQFYKIDCQEGTSEFTMTHPWTGAAGTYRFLTPPAFQSVENKMMRVSVQLELL